MRVRILSAYFFLLLMSSCSLYGPIYLSFQHDKINSQSNVFIDSVIVEPVVDMRHFSAFEVIGSYDWHHIEAFSDSVSDVINEVTKEALEVSEIGITHSSHPILRTYLLESFVFPSACIDSFPPSSLSKFPQMRDSLCHAARLMLGVQLISVTGKQTFWQIIHGFSIHNASEFKVRMSIDGGYKSKQLNIMMKEAISDLQKNMSKCISDSLFLKALKSSH